MKLRLSWGCKHLRTRCLHGDEINQYVRVSLFGNETVYRQICATCGKRLNRTAICTVLGAPIHRWLGPWVEPATPMLSGLSFGFKEKSNNTQGEN